jgi:pyruvate/2-oxoglutarate dehydrogenase complex dihydrolipoamide dehydrogenase (E3) component
MSQRVVVIGGGPAGIEAAVEAARCGAGVTLVSDMPAGGRATHASLVPSKVWLHAAELRAMRATGKLGRASDAEMAALGSDVELFVSRTSERHAQRLEDAGVRTLRGRAHFASSHEIVLVREGKDDKRIAFDRAVIASGSNPSFPSGFFGPDAQGPDGHFILAPRFLSKVRSIPKTLVVVGGGTSGAEAAHAFSRLGAEVTWIVGELGLLPAFDRDLTDVLGGVLVERGVKIVQGKNALSITKVGQGDETIQVKLDGGRTYAAERGFVALGRRADLSGLGLAAAGLEAEGTIAVNERMQTAVPHLFAAGDVTGGELSASRSSAEGWTAGRGAAGAEVPPLDPQALIHAVYADPELAKVGLSPAEAVRHGRASRVATIALGDTLRGALEGIGLDRHRPGLLRIALSDDDRVVGATAVGPRAAELLAPLALAIRSGVPGKELASTFFASPTLSEAIGTALR